MQLPAPRLEKPAAAAFRPTRYCGPMGVIAGLLGMLAYIALAAAAPSTVRVSVGTGNVQGNGNSTQSAVTPDGRFIAFVSAASNLVPGDTNGVADVFVHDRATGATERVSVDSDGLEANFPSDFKPAISRNGRFVAFTSFASNLVFEDFNATWDVFLRDRKNGTTERISVTNAGAEANSNSVAPSISATGRYIAFRSDASNLVTGDMNSFWDIFVRDRKLGSTEIISVSTGGAAANNFCSNPIIAPDGSFVAFRSAASTLTGGDTNGAWDVFIRDRGALTTIRVSVADNESEANGNSNVTAVTPDGRYVVFESLASNLPALGALPILLVDANGVMDVFVRDRTLGTTVRVSLDDVLVEGNAASDGGAITDDGRYVLFGSRATNLIAGDTNGRKDIFIRDMMTATTTRVNLSDADAEANFDSDGPVMTPSGRYIGFHSDANNLLSGGGDSNIFTDVFVRERLISVNPEIDAPSKRRLGRVVLGASRKRSFLIQNTGAAVLWGSVGTLAAPFEVVKGGGAFKLNPGGSKRVKIEFTPTTLGKVVQKLTITSNDPDEATIKVKIIGTGV